jgi:hypothetical protein
MWRLPAAAALTALAMTAPSVAVAGDFDILFAQGPAYNPPPAKEGYSYPDCYCTDSDGQRVEMGQRACLRIGTRLVLARCEMSLNNPAWRPESEGCPSV